LLLGMNAAPLSSAIRPASSASWSSAVSSTMMGSFLPKKIKRWRQDNQKSDGYVPERMPVCSSSFCFLLTLWLLDAGLFFCAGCLIDIGR
jgi:hypothetical protein